MEGGCTCRQVRYRLTGTPLIVHACHCRWCQRETGTAHALNALYEADRVAHIAGELEIVLTSVDALTEAAGMTHGSLYSQFGSKERLVEEAVAYAIAAKGREASETSTLGDYVSEYLSATHRDGPGNGCPLAALSCEVSHQNRAVRDRFTAGVRGMVRLLSGRMDPGLKQRQRDEEALATITSLVGAVVLARAVNDPKLSDDILRTTRISRLIVHRNQTEKHAASNGRSWHFATALRWSLSAHSDDWAHPARSRHRVALVSQCPLTEAQRPRPFVDPGTDHQIEPTTASSAQRPSSL